MSDPTKEELERANSWLLAQGLFSDEARDQLAGLFAEIREPLEAEIERLTQIIVRLREQLEMSTRMNQEIGQSNADHVGRYREQEAEIKRLRELLDAYRGANEVVE